MAAPAEVTVFDGQVMKVWAYNGQIPGPTMRVRLGETVRVHFTNRLAQPTTIHWHGIRVPNSMDGVPDVTQPAVPPGGSFVYEFTPKDPGTFWYHPHVRSSEQVERGLYGALIVDDARPRPYSQDVLWVLDDWRLTREGAIDPEFVTRHDLAHDGRWGNRITVNGRTDEVLTVKAGQRIRLRLLNAANGRVFAPDFSALDAEIIAFDGMYAARPLVPSGLELAPGNRVDLGGSRGIQQAGREFAIINRFTRRPHVLAQIMVEREIVETPVFSSPASARIPAWEGSESAQSRLRYVLDARRGGEYGIEWTLNGLAYPQTSDDVLVHGEWAKVTFVNRSARLHPMHIHGLFFKVLSRNGRPVDELFWRDTVLLRPRETIDVGVVPLDVGVWMVHCHILEHAAAGMMTLLTVAPREP